MYPLNDVKTWHGALGKNSKLLNLHPALEVGYLIKSKVSLHPVASQVKSWLLNILLVLTPAIDQGMVTAAGGFLHSGRVALCWVIFLGSLGGFYGKVASRDLCLSSEVALAEMWEDGLGAAQERAVRKCAPFFVLFTLPGTINCINVKK